MDKKEYSQLQSRERIEIYRLHADGKSLRFIANSLGRSASTISRELRRNSKPGKKWQGSYDPERAQALYLRRHARGRTYKLERQPELREQVLDQLAMDRSPEQIAGRLALEQGRPVISHESIYRYIYWRVWSFKENLHYLLPRRKRRRGKDGRRRSGGQPPIPHRRPICERPPGALNRSRNGHWEADMMQFSDQKGAALLVLCDRRSRYAYLLRREGKKARDVIGGLHTIFDGLPENRCKTVTFDNGQEFRLHHELTRERRIKTFFCDVRSPWQKGTVENTIGRLRRFLPRKTDPNTIHQNDLETLMQKVNSTPRKCLGFKTPAEVFFNQRVALQT